MNVIQSLCHFGKETLNLSTDVYAVFVFATVVKLTTLLFTVLLNVLVIMAIKTTRRLNTKANIYYYK